MKFLFTALFFSSLVFSHHVQRTATPRYQFSINENESKISETDFSLLLNVFDELYGKTLGNKTLDWRRDISWSNPYIGAGSNQIRNDFYILLYGGLVRAKFMTIGTVSAVLCHEFGHKLGGMPRQQFPGEITHWSSSEGQADTFAAAICLPAVFEKLKKVSPHLLIYETEEVALAVCAKVKEVERCRWVATSGIDLIQAMQVYFDIDIPLADPAVTAIEAPSQSLITAYPSYQCRMDIFKTYAAHPTAPRLRCWYVD